MTTVEGRQNTLAKLTFVDLWVLDRIDACQQRTGKPGVHIRCLRMFPSALKALKTQPQMLFGRGIALSLGGVVPAGMGIRYADNWQLARHFGPAWNCDVLR